MTKLDREQIKQVLRTDPTNWGVGFFDIQMRFRYYQQAADEIDTLEKQLQSAKTAALIDVAKVMTARGDWQLASEILAYRSAESEPKIEPGVPTLGVDQIISKE